MLPTRPEPKPSKVRELLESFGSAMFDDEDAEEQGLVRPRHRDMETPRQRYVRDMETRWAEFHQAEGSAEPAAVALRWMLVPVVGALIGVGRWILHLSYAQQWKLLSGPALIYLAWEFWWRNRAGEQADD